MSNRKTYHVVPNKGGRWDVKGEKASRASSSHETKKEAVERGKALAKNQPFGQIVIHKVTAEIPDSVYRNISEEVKLGIFANTSEAITFALKKSYAKKSRTYLKWLVGKEGINESEMLKELAKLRK